MSYDAVVIGGGIVGASVGYHLARAGADALLVDRADPGRATDAGAGIVSPATSSRTASDAWFRLGVAAADYYPDLAADLRGAVDEVGYGRPGLLSVATDADEAARLEQSLARIRERQDRLGHPEAGSVATVSPEAARDRVPPLGHVERAFVVERAARVDGRTFAAALREAGRDRGLDVAREDARSLVLRDGAVAGVETEADRYRADAAVVAGGAWSAAWGDQLGVDLPIEPLRGQIAHLDADRETGDWPMVAGIGDHYLVPWPDGRIAAGATREPGVGFDPATTAAGVHEVLDATMDLAPGLGDAELASVRVGLRPTTPDGLPILGRVDAVAGAYVATGHGPTGLTVGPYSGRAVADLVLDEPAPVDLSPFAPGRF
ncbi:MAG: NAD(P)/FAD-dependent oxidoreductase [Haloarculaceae archaeon]